MLWSRSALGGEWFLEVCDSVGPGSFLSVEYVIWFLFLACLYNNRKGEFKTCLRGFVFIFLVKTVSLRVDTVSATDGC